MTSLYDEISDWTYRVFSRALEALDFGDLLEIETPNSYLMKFPETYEVAFIMGRKRLRVADRKPHIGHKTFVLSLCEHTTETEVNGYTSYKVSRTWELKEKEDY